MKCFACHMTKKPPAPASPETIQGWMALTGAAYHAALGQPLVDSLCEVHRAAFDEMVDGLRSITTGAMS